MAQSISNQWELPEFHMNAGETKMLQLPIYDNYDRLVNAQGMEGRLAFSDYINRGACLFFVNCTTAFDERCGGHVFVAELQPSHTIDLCGKYIYQLSAYDPYDGSRGVLRGVVTVGHNADKAALEEETN